MTETNKRDVRLSPEEPPISEYIEFMKELEELKNDTKKDDSDKKKKANVIKWKADKTKGIIDENINKNDNEPNINEVKEVVDKTERAINALHSVINNPIIPWNWDLAVYAWASAPNPNDFLENVPEGVEVDIVWFPDFSKRGNVDVKVRVTVETADAHTKIDLWDIDLKVTVKEAPKMNAKSGLIKLEKTTKPENLVELDMNNLPKWLKVEYKEDIEALFKVWWKQKVTVQLKDINGRVLNECEVDVEVEQDADANSNAKPDEKGVNPEGNETVTESSEIKAKSDLIFLEGSKPEPKDLLENIQRDYNASYKNGDDKKFNEKWEKEVEIEIKDNKWTKIEGSPFKVNVNIIEKDDIVAETGKSYSKDDWKPENPRELVKNAPTDCKVEYKDSNDADSKFSTVGKQKIELVVKDKDNEEIKKLEIEIEITDSSSSTSESTTESEWNGNLIEQGWNWLWDKVKEFSKWAWGQFDAIFSKKNWKNEPRKNVWRLGWFLSAIVWAWKVAKNWVKSFFWKWGSDGSWTSASDVLEALEKLWKK